MTVLYHCATTAALSLSLDFLKIESAPNKDGINVFTRNDFQNFASEQDEHLVDGLADDVVVDDAAVLGEFLKRQFTHHPHDSVPT